MTQQMVEHHTHYKELHGYDKTVWMTNSDHQKLHHRLRKEGKCNVPVGELKKIANKAHQRTDKAKWNQRGRREYKNQFEKETYQSHVFDDSMMTNVFHRELIKYNFKTGDVFINCWFVARTKNDGAILYIDLV